MSGARIFAGYVFGGLTASACFVGVAAGLSIAFGVTPDQKALPFVETNPQMRAAMVSARSTLPYFYQEARRRDSAAPFLRLATPAAEKGALTHVWAERCDLSVEPIRCVVSDNPPGASVKIGDPISASPDAISDWMLRDEATGRIEGAYTLRVTLASLTPERAADLSAKLEPLPRTPSPESGEPTPPLPEPPVMVAPAPAER